MEQAGGAASSRYWCHMCSQRVNPMQEDEVMKCPICESGFVEEILEDMHMAAGADHQDHILIHENENENERDNSNSNSNSNSSDGALSLWAPILLGMIANPIRLHQRSLMDNDDGGSGDADDDNDDEQAVVRRRRRRSSAAAVLQLLQSIRAGMVLDHQHQHHHHHHQEQAEQGQGQGGVIFINPFINQITTSIPSSSSSSSLGDYFIGPGLDLLLQHLSENDPNRYGTPPTHKDALDALPTLTIQEDEAEADAIQCAVCLDECEVGSQVKEMPCKHKFHTNCILPWLQLHSSCPVCRYQLPTDDSKLLSHPSSSSSSSTANHNHDNDNDDNNNNNNNNNNGPGIRQFSVPLLWPFTTLFSSSTSQPTTPSLITHPASTDAAPPTADNDTSA